MSAATTERIVPNGTWAVDNAHSSANFEVEHGGVSVFRGGFRPIDATLTATDDGLVLEGAVKVESISVDDENIRPHLLSPDFFDVAPQPADHLPLDRDRRRRRRPHGHRQAVDGRRLATRRRRPVASAAPSPSARGSRSSRSRSRPPSTGPPSGWSGRWSFRAASRRSPTTFASSSSSSCSRTGLTRCGSSPSPAASAAIPTTRACSATRGAGA